MSEKPLQGISPDQKQRGGNKQNFNLKLLLIKHYDYTILVLYHFFLFIGFFFLLLFLFKDIITNFWYAGRICIFCNDSWHFIENILHPDKPEYILHLLATGWHFDPFYFLILALTHDSGTSLILAVFIVQYIISLVSVLLVYYFFGRSFHLEKKTAILTTILVSSILFPYYLMQSSSELLFLFYQLLTWYFYTQKKYSLMLISSSVTFALRFNGAFFVIGIGLIYLFLYVKHDVSLSKKELIKLQVVLVVMFLIGFSSFIFTFFVYNNFWYPLTSQMMKYDIYIGHNSINTFQIPFLWWISYILYVLDNVTVANIVFLALGVFSFLLGILSVFLLLKEYQRKKEQEYLYLLLVYSIQFIGLNLLVSLSNFARFLAYSFPIIPALPIIVQKTNKKKTFILLIVFSILALVLNILWLANYPTATF